LPPLSLSRVISRSAVIRLTLVRPEYIPSLSGQAQNALVDLQRT
jgi:hypothetical protein